MPPSPPLEPELDADPELEAEPELDAEPELEAPPELEAVPELEPVPLLEPPELDAPPELEDPPPFPLLPDDPHRAVTRTSPTTAAACTNDRRLFGMALIVTRKPPRARERRKLQNR